MFVYSGMAVREEFEYISFRCCYCYHLNPARKKRPTAPKLEFDTNKSQQRIRRFSSSDSDKNSELETDSETEKTRLNKSPVMDLRTSDTEKTSDFDKLSDLDMKNSDGESPQPSTDQVVENIASSTTELPNDNVEVTAETRSQTPTQD